MKNFNKGFFQIIPLIITLAVLVVAIVAVYYLYRGFFNSYNAGTVANQNNTIQNNNLSIPSAKPSTSQEFDWEKNVPASVITDCEQSIPKNLECPMNYSDMLAECIADDAARYVYKTNNSTSFGILPGTYNCKSFIPGSCIDEATSKLQNCEVSCSEDNNLHDKCVNACQLQECSDLRICSEEYRSCIDVAVNNFLSKIGQN